MTHHTHTILHMSALIAHINICVMYSRRIVYNIHTLAATYNKTHEVSIVEPKQQWTKKYTKKPTNNKKTEQIAVQKRICFRAFQYRSAVCRVVLAFACMFYSVWCRQDFSTCRLALDWRHNRSISNLIRALLWWYQIPWWCVAISITYVRHVFPEEDTSILALSACSLHPLTLFVLVLKISPHTFDNFLIWCMPRQNQPSNWVKLFFISVIYTFTQHDLMILLYTYATKGIDNHYFYNVFARNYVTPYTHTQTVRCKSEPNYRTTSIHGAPYFRFFHLFVFLSSIFSYVNLL